MAGRHWQREPAKERFWIPNCIDMPQPSLATRSNNARYRRLLPKSENLQQSSSGTIKSCAARQNYISH